MPGSADDIRNIFTSIADRYDAVNTILTLSIDRRWRKRAIELCSLGENSKVLDLCCGTGQMMNYACRAAGKDSEVIGLDFAEEMLKTGHKRLAKSLAGYKYSLVKGDVLALPFGDNTFDCVIIAFGLRNIEDYEDKKKAIVEMLRVSKPGGKIVCLELSRPRAPVLKHIYSLYFNHVLPLIGHLVTGDKKAYIHLRDSVNSFMSKVELKNAFESAGCKNTGFDSLTCGAAAVHYGSKPVE